MLADRNAEEQVYDATLANLLVDNINGGHIAGFEKLLSELESLYDYFAGCVLRIVWEPCKAPTN